MNKVAIYCLDRRFNSYLERTKRIAQECLRVAGQKSVTLDIYLVGDETMRLLNSNFRGKNSPTDILSFSEPKGFPHPEAKNRYLGELYLNPSYAAKAGHSTLQLLIHGILHLLGYNHQKKNDRIKMEKLEKVMMRKMQIHTDITRTTNFIRGIRSHS